MVVCRALLYSAFELFLNSWVLSRDGKVNFESLNVLCKLEIWSLNFIYVVFPLMPLCKSTNPCSATSLYLVSIVHLVDQELLFTYLSIRWCGQWLVEVWTKSCLVEQVRLATAEALGELVGLISRPQLTIALPKLLPAILAVYVLFAWTSQIFIELRCTICGFLFGRLMILSIHTFVQHLRRLCGQIFVVIMWPCCLCADIREKRRIPCQLHIASTWCWMQCFQILILH